MAQLDREKQKGSAMADIEAYMVVGHQNTDDHFVHILISSSLMSYQKAHTAMLAQARIDGFRFSVEHELIAGIMCSN